MTGGLGIAVVIAPASRLRGGAFPCGGELVGGPPGPPLSTALT